MSGTLPLYESHKTVRAAAIIAIEFHGDGSATIATEHELVPAKAGYRERFKGTEDGDLGWYVRYADGYESWSPTKAFVEGYTRVR